MIKCKQIPIKVSILYYNQPLTNKKLEKELTNSIKQLYCNNILLKKEDCLVANKQEYKVYSLSYSYHVNKGDSYITITVKLTDT